MSESRANRCAAAIARDAEKRGYRNVGGTTTRKPQPEPAQERVIIRSLALMDAFLARPSGGKARAWFEGVGLQSRLHMTVGSKSG